MAGSTNEEFVEEFPEKWCPVATALRLWVSGEFITAPKIMRTMNGLTSTWELSGAGVECRSTADISGQRDSESEFGGRTG
jgi:hypothetical protein